MNRGGPLRTCGKRWATEEAAWCSKRAQAEGAVVIPCAMGCGGFHVAVPKGLEARARVAEVTSGTKGRKAPRYTGPDSLTRAAVLLRDKAACVCCGRTVEGRIFSIQHRKRRSQGGTNCTCNLIVLLGDGVRGCHFRIDSRIDPEDEARGYTVRSRGIPALVPVMVFDQSGGGATLYPTCNGEWTSAVPVAGCAA